MPKTVKFIQKFTGILVAVIVMLTIIIQPTDSVPASKYWFYYVIIVAVLFICFFAYKWTESYEEQYKHLQEIERDRKERRIHRYNNLNNNAY